MRSANGRLTISGLRDVLADVNKITKVQPKEEELGGWKQLAEAWRIHDGWGWEPQAELRQMPRITLCFSHASLVIASSFEETLCQGDLS